MFFSFAPPLFFPSPCVARVALTLFLPNVHVLLLSQFLNEDGTISTSAANFRPKKNPKAKK